MQDSGRGSPCKLLTNHLAISVSLEGEIVHFSNGSPIIADLIIGADGIRFSIRMSIGIVLNIETSGQSYFQCISSTRKLQDLRPEKFISPNALEFWAALALIKS